MTNPILKIFSFFALFIVSSQVALAQDFMASQAPIDRKVKAVDTLALARIIEREMEENPSYELYEEWDNIFANRAVPIPDTYKIDLRDFCMPTVSRAVTSNFGARWGRAHRGLDIKVYVGDTIRAAFSGKVRVVKNQGARKGYGKYIVIRHPNGLETIYGHLSKQLVSENQVVKAGDVIGLGGNTGRSTGSHLHFETRLCGIALNPALMFDFRNQDVTGDYYVYNKRTYDSESREATRLRGVVGSGGYTVADVRGTNYNEDTTGGMVEEPTPVEPAENKAYHKVKKGETLYSIAKKHGVSVDKLCQLNRLSKKSKIRPGNILRYS